jgi:hypothetical protein
VVLKRKEKETWQDLDSLKYIGYFSVGLSELVKTTRYSVRIDDF